MKNAEIIKRADMLFNERKGSVEQIWDLVDRFVVPMRGDFYNPLDSEGSVDWRHREVYDSSAIFFAQSLAASMQSNLTSSSQRWFDLRFREEAMNDIKMAKVWLDDCATRVYKALEDSNFDIEIAEAYTDLVAYGTAVLTEELDDDEGVVFSAVPLREAVYEMDHRKRVYRFIRRLQWTPTQIYSKFGEDGTPDMVKRKATDAGASNQRMEVLFAIYPRDNIKSDPGKPTNPMLRPYGYKYVLKTGAVTLGKEGGYYEMPSFVSRWRTVAGSRWGKSPAMDAMGDILTLNQLKEATLEAAGKAIDPPQKAREGAVVGNVDLERGGLTMMTDINDIAPMDSGTRFDVSNLEVTQLTEAIRNHFYQNQLELKDSPAMTATEVSVRYELMQRTLGPTLSRLKTDLLNPLIQRTFNLLFREQRLLPVPEGMPIGQMDIEYTGPLPRAQQGNTATEIIRWMTEIANLSEVYPEARESVDVDEAVQLVASLRGVPAKATRDKREIEKERKKRQQMEEQAQQLQLAQGAGEAMKSMGEGQQALEGPEALQ